MLPIKGYEETYVISESGEIQNIHTGRVLRQYNDRWGYAILSLSKDKTYSTKQVHRLVAETYLPNPDNLPQVNHKDRDKWNNKVGNLEWCTGQQNAEHCFAKHYKFVNPTGEVVEVFNLHKFSRENNLSQPSMSNVHRGVAKQHQGWTKCP